MSRDEHDLSVWDWESPNVYDQLPASVRNQRRARQATEQLDSEVEF